MSNVLIDTIHRILVNPLMKSSRKRSTWHPSQASVKYLNVHGEEVTVGACLRKQYYEHIDEPVTATSSPSGLMRMHAGNLWSDYIAQKCKEAGVWLGDEVSFYEQDLNVSGRIDIMIKEESSGLPVGMELKTVGMFTSNGVIKPTSKYPLLPKEDHVLQSMLYLYHYQKFGVKKWVLLYINRDSGEMREHVIRLKHVPEEKTYYPVISNEMGTYEWDHLTISALVQRWSVLSQALQSKTAPPRDYQLAYPNSKIKNRLDRGEMSRTLAKRVESSLKRQPNVTDQDPPIVDMGDWQCAVCAYKDTCYAHVAPAPVKDDDAYEDTD